MYFINCEFVIEFDNKFTAKIEINYHHNTDSKNLKSYLLYYIGSCGSRSYKFDNINHMIINTISYMCNITYDNYINNPTPMVERRLNMNIARNPHLINVLDRKENHPLIGKLFHIPFIN